LRDGCLNNTFPALFRRVAPSRVRLHEHCDIVLCDRASVKHDIVVFEIRVHDLTVVHVRQTPQSVQEDTLSQWKRQTFFTSDVNLERFNVSTHNTCNETQMVSVPILSRMYKVSKKSRAVGWLDARGWWHGSYALQGLELPRYTFCNEIGRVSFQSFDCDVSLFPAEAMSIKCVRFSCKTYFTSNAIHTLEFMPHPSFRTTL